MFDQIIPCEGEHEILHMYKAGRHDKNIVEMEVHFLSDHQVFTKVKINGVTKRMDRSFWRKIEDLYKAVERKQDEWDITWNPLYQPRLNEFTRSVEL